MFEKTAKKFLALLLAVIMAVGMFPATVLADEINLVPAGENSDEETGDNGDGTLTEETEEELYTTTYEDFFNNLQILEDYADKYAKVNSGKDATELVINYIRTGVEKYTQGLWNVLAGDEDTGFTAYVKAQDLATGTTVRALKNLENFYAPNGDRVEFSHMFGAMNIAYIAKKSQDLGSWAGDLCDLMVQARDSGVEATELEEMVLEIREKYLGQPDEEISGFGEQDIYGDLDSFYLIAQARQGIKLSTAMEGYYTEDLTNTDRAVYFLNNRFGQLYKESSKDDVRAAIYDTYRADVAISMLEADENITNKDFTEEQNAAMDKLRYACCYSFADYLYELSDECALLKDEPVIEEDDNEGEGGEGEGGGNEGGEGEGGEGGESGLPSNKYYSVYSSTDSTIAPGVTQNIKYAITADNKQIAYYTATVDISRDDVSVHANYKDNNPNNGWGMQRVVDQMNAAKERHSDPESPLYIENYTPVIGVNGDFYNMSTGKPSGALVMEGVQYNGVNGANFFAIVEETDPETGATYEKAVIGEAKDWAQYEGRIKEAVGGSIILVKDGKIAVSSSSNYYATRASRTCVGITEEGKVIIMVLDGRQEPFSAGGSSEEIAQIMYDAGCYIAMNLDGGGSTTFVAKPEGEDDIAIVNRPSDGFARSVSSSLFVVSTAKSSKEFDHAIIETDYDYLTVGTSIELNPVGVSNTGNSAPLPENLSWKISDETIATIEDNTLTAKAEGEVKVELISNGTTYVGEKTFYVVKPESISFAEESITVIYGEPSEIKPLAYYSGNAVAINPADVVFTLNDDKAGTFDGFSFTSQEESKIRNALIKATLAHTVDAEKPVSASITAKMYSKDESVFDFNNVTAGDRQLAWDRNVSNSNTYDEHTYYVDVPGEDMIIDYTFGIDMSTIEMPEQLNEIVFMLPGADVEGASAWTFLLQLAERVCNFTEVKATIVLDEDVELVSDLSEITVVNEYFETEKVTFNEETRELVIDCKWIDQTAAIPANTANPICIVTGIKLRVKDTAAWDRNGCISLVNTGNISYDIYLRANALYSFANQPANQAKYGLIPFEHTIEEYGEEHFVGVASPERGAHLTEVYKEFNDSVVLNKSVLQGWQSLGDFLYYYVDHEALTGVQYVPSFEDPAVKKFYEFDVDGACNGALTGLVKMGSELYYAIQGEMKTGWWPVFNNKGESDYYYFDTATGKAVDGKQTINTFDYVFEDKILVRGDLYRDSKGLRYRWAGDWLNGEWLDIDGNTYYFDKETKYAATGYTNMALRDGDPIKWYWHLFDENSVFQGDYTGIYYHTDGNMHYLENGVKNDYAALRYIDGYFYYFASNGNAIRNTSYYFQAGHEITNGLPIKTGTYRFDSEGRMVDPKTTGTPVGDTTAKNGVAESEDGKLYYYRNNEEQKGLGLIYVITESKYEYDAWEDTYVLVTSGDYYYVRTNGELAVGNYWITNTNGLMESGMYHFDEKTGKLTGAPEEEKPVQPEEPGETGFVTEGEEIKFYVDGKVQYGAGLIIIDGEQYYVRSNGVVATGEYWITNTNGLLPMGKYTFDEKGKLIKASEETPETPDETKEGFIEEDGAIYYYKNGKVQYGAGLIMVNGSYYYVRSNGQLATGNYWITNNNGLLPAKMYEFSTEDGKMIK